MKNYLKSRLYQPTTWFGLSAIAAAVASNGLSLTPELMTGVFTALGLIHVNESK